MYQTLRFDTSTFFIYNEVIAERGGDVGVNVGDVSETCRRLNCLIDSKLLFQ